MNYEAIESKFIATAEKGEVSSILIRPDDAKWLLVLGHGASTNMRQFNAPDDRRTVSRYRNRHIPLSVSLHGTWRRG